MNDIVDRLRSNARHLRSGGARMRQFEELKWDILFDDAAAEIERLRKIEGEFERIGSEVQDSMLR